MRNRMRKILQKINSESSDKRKNANQVCKENEELRQSTVESLWAH
jgi:hypothetical protein